MTTAYLTIPEDRLDDVAPEVRRALEDGAYLDDATLKELRRVGQYVADPLAYLGWIGTPGWYLDEDGHSHYVAQDRLPKPGRGTRPTTQPKEAKVTMAMACKAIARRKAEWIGYAALVAGGYIAVDGPRIERISRDEHRAIREDAENDTVRGRREDSRRLAAAYHELPSGDYARVLPYRSWDADLVMVVPADHPLAQHGYSLPASLVRELIPALQAAGYDTAGLLGETSEGAEVV